MTEFECNVKDLETPNTPVVINDTGTDNGKDIKGPDKLYTIDQQKQEKDPSPVSVRHNKRSKDDISNSVTPKSNDKSLDDNVMNIFLNDIKDKKNHRIFIVVILSYVILNSQAVYNIINNMFPYLMESVNQVNIKGKLIIAVLISVAVIISKSSLLN